MNYHVGITNFISPINYWKKLKGQGFAFSALGTHEVSATARDSDKTDTDALLLHLLYTAASSLLSAFDTAIFALYSQLRQELVGSILFSHFEPLIDFS